MTVFCAFIIDVPIGFVKKIYRKKPFEENISRIGHGDRGKEPFPPGHALLFWLFLLLR